MKITIGENIKRMRRARNITQEELAELFGVSCTAVSKWERGETYPDITLIFPLANYFEVSVDELMGYYSARMEQEIRELIKQRNDLFNAGKMKEAIELMTQARKEYPNDYRIMHCYMWDVAGSYADNAPEVLLAHREEFLEICDKIISGCGENRIRLDAYNMQAKLLHAEGKTAEALHIYRENFPSWYQTVGQKSEQLFAKDTPEFQEYLISNMIELFLFAMDKKLKEIWHCKDISVEGKARQGLELGDAIAEMGKKLADERFAYVEYIVYSNHVYKLVWFSEDVKAVALAMDKCLDAARRCDELAGRDEIFRKFRSDSEGKVVKLLPGLLNYYKNTDKKAYVKWRGTPECASVIEKYQG